MVLKFEKGQRVRHSMGTQEMMVDEYEKEMKKEKFSIFSDAKFIPTGNYTGNVWCVWMVGNIERGDYFDQDKLVLIDN